MENWEYDVSHPIIPAHLRWVICENYFDSLISNYLFLRKCRTTMAANGQVLLQVGYFIKSSPEPLPNWKYKVEVNNKKSDRYSSARTKVQRCKHPNLGAGCNYCTLPIFICCMLYSHTVSMYISFLFEMPRMLQRFCCWDWVIIDRTNKGNSFLQVHTFCPATLSDNASL